MAKDGFEVHKKAFVLPESMLAKLQEHAREDKPVWNQEGTRIFNNGKIESRRNDMLRQQAFVASILRFQFCFCGPTEENDLFVLYF